MQKRLIQLFQKYKFVVLILLLGIVLMTLPVGKESVADKPNQEPAAPLREQVQTTLARELEEILSQISGAGAVRVMLTPRAGEETVYQTDTQVNSSDTGTSGSEKTVVITNGDRNQTGMIRQINPASYMGAIVVCQGGDDPTVQLAIVQAVANVTGLGADRISVLKMK